MYIFGKNITKNELLSKIGDISQFGGVKIYELADGCGKNIRCVDLKSPNGLDFTVLLDRGMDISSMFYKSIPVCWKSATGETSPAFFESRNMEFLRTFFGGMLTTCGLTYMGPPTMDENEELGIHGRISNLSASNIYADGKWINNEYTMWVQGKVREAKVYGDKLELSRKITTNMGDPKIIIEDTVSNIGFELSPIMMLYHINIGYPILDKTSKLIEGKAIVDPRDEEAKKGYAEYSKFSGPVQGFKEQVFIHNIAADSDGYCNIAIVNEAFNDSSGIGLAIKFNKDSLPYLFQWKQMGMGEYVCGLEPSNSGPGGRSVERKKGSLRFIKPGEEIKYRIELMILKSNQEIDNYKNKVLV